VNPPTTRSDWREREREREEGEKENKTIKKYYLKKMKSGIEIIVWVFLRKLVVKVDIGTFWIATLTPTAGDALRGFSNKIWYIATPKHNFLLSLFTW
jgi:hypothetical protein